MRNINIKGNGVNDNKIKNVLDLLKHERRAGC